METKSLEDTQKPPKFLIVGASGSGKTTALGTLPPSMKGLLLNMFGNPQVLRNLPHRKQVDLIDYEEWNIESGAAYFRMDKDRQELEALDPFPYDWVCLDTGTGLSRVCEHFGLASHPQGKGMGGSPGEHHYRGISWLVSQYIYQLLALPCIIIVHCHIDDEKDERLATYINRAYLAGGKNRKTIYGYFSEVYHAFGEPEIDPTTGKTLQKFSWQTMPDQGWSFLKSTLNDTQRLFGTYIEPNYAKLLEVAGYSREEVKVAS